MMEMDWDKLHEECGVFGIFDRDADGEVDVVSACYHALYALQHRGQESCGIAVNAGGTITGMKDMGLVGDVFTKERMAALPRGEIALGHVRYATMGDRSRENSQPMIIRHLREPMAISHNGNLTNASELRQAQELMGGIFHTTSDTEVIAYLLTRERLMANDLEHAIEATMPHLQGAYSLVITSPHKLIAVRDPKGFRPLCMGKIHNNGVVFASESCALNAIGATFVRDIDPGEIVVVTHDEIRSIRTHCGQPASMCVFEYVYFARPDSIIDGASVHMARRRAGEYLAMEHPVEADVVIGVPDSGLDAALGYSMQSGIPYGIGLLKNKYIGRTFIAPTQKQRENSVRIKLNAMSAVVKDKRVVMVDDSIVRGTTSLQIIRLLREAGAKEVHMRLTCPPFISPCYFGTDVDSTENLIAYRHTVEEIREIIGADSLGFLSIEALHKVAEGCELSFCDACFTGNYPVQPPKNPCARLAGGHKEQE